MIRRSFFSRLIGRAARELADLSVIGAGLFGYHAARIGGRKEHEVTLKGVGRVTVRPADSDLSTLRQVFHGEEYHVPVPEAEKALRQAYDEILANRRTPVIVDAGANIGAASLWFRKMFPKVHIVAIEPDPAAFELLMRNMQSDPLVTAIEAAIGAEGGYVRMFTAGDSWATQTERSDSGARIITMQEAFGQVPDGTPFIAKIDIEGFESDLFSKNLDWLDSVAAVFVEPHDWRFPGQHTSRSFQRAMGTRDFELFVVGENLLYVRL
jgi:FkbM family methyltransferase